MTKNQLDRLRVQEKSLNLLIMTDSAIFIFLIFPAFSPHLQNVDKFIVYIRPTFMWFLILGGSTFYYCLIMSAQKLFRRHFLQGTPCHTASNWSAAASTSAGASVRMPASKLRVVAPFMPSPAPVRLAEPM